MRDEAPWVELVEMIGIVGVRDELVELGIAEAKAAGIAVWLDDQANLRRRPGAAAASRAKDYRRELRDLGKSNGAGPPKLRAIPG